MASSKKKGVTAVSLRQAIVTNIFNHWSSDRDQDTYVDIREKVNGGRQPQVAGILMGKRRGTTVEIVNSFKLFLCPDGNGGQRIMPDAFVANLQKFKSEFGEMDVVGWYVTGSGVPNQWDMYLHQQVLDIERKLVFLKVNSSCETTTEPQFAAYESIWDEVDGELFVELCCTIDAPQQVVVEVFQGPDFGTPAAGSTRQAPTARQWTASEMIGLTVFLFMVVIFIGFTIYFKQLSHDFIEGFKSSLNDLNFGDDDYDY